MTMGHLTQNINFPLALRSEIVNTGGLVAALTGVVNDTVLLFTAAGVVTGPPSYITEINDADDGTSVRITEAGVYLVQLHIEETALQASTVGISQDVDPAGLSARPDFAIPGFIDVSNITTVAGQFTTPMDITNRVFQTGIGTVIRFHGSTSGGAKPVGDFNRFTAYYRITRINQANT